MPTDNQQFYYKTNRLQQLRGFFYTAQFKSISKAADFMNLSQPSVSLQIRSLEDDLKVSLFIRQHHTLTLTEEGKKLYTMSSPIIQGMDSLYDAFIAQVEAKGSGHLDIIGNNGAINYIFPQIVKDFDQKHPDISLTIHYATGEQGIAKLLDGKGDLFVTPRNFIIPEGFSFHNILTCEPVLITPPDHPLAGKKNLRLDEIALYKLCLPPENVSIIEGIRELFAYHNQNLQLGVEFVDWELTKKYVEIGHLISIGADIIVEKDNNKLVGTSLAHYFPPIQYGYVVMDSHKHLDKVKCFIDILDQWKNY